ncbi:RWD-domain-containing protein, partial [Delitschia confertaspora ATCC 74209]
MDYTTEDDERVEELATLQCIFPDELTLHATTPYAARIDLAVIPQTPLPVVFPPPAADIQSDDTELSRLSLNPTTPSLSGELHTLSYLPPLKLDVVLPDGYPSDTPPQVKLSTDPAWLPKDILESLRKEAVVLWEEYGHGQVLFSYISSLQDAAERAFGLADGANGSVELPYEMKIALLDFDIQMKKEKFNKETFDCGICLEPKKGSACYRLQRCQHVFCIDCLKSFYNNCILEGDVNGIKCLDPDCGKQPLENTSPDQRKKRKERLLTPNELLQIPLERGMVQRYVDIKRKKKIEADKSTIYCPREWCQGAARSDKYPKFTDLSQIPESDDEDQEEEESAPVEASEKPVTVRAKGANRLAVCEDCNYAFCSVCLAGWHGEYQACWPRSRTELTEEEQASMNYILMHTSPCPTCSVPCQKSHGCNHMRCFQCKTHFCYLCSSWLHPDNPYRHFNDKGKSCFQRLWELEEGD